MGKISAQKPVKLITGFIFKDPQYYCKSKDLLASKFGSLDFESADIPFNLTDYYASEFGRPLTRKFLSFKKLIPAQNLPEIKAYTNRLEERLSCRGKRQVNLDPGYLDLAKLILASTKDYAHRIYLGKGIFSEITLYFKDGSFTPWEWTYPDYRSAVYIEIFNKIRQAYAQELKKIDK
jgi:hypothetical protein